jgi:hypothetical protein
LTARPECLAQQGVSKDGRSPLVCKFNTNTVGGSPTASHFLLLRQKESNQRKGDPGLPPLRGFPPLLDWSGFLINSHDPLRGHVLKHIRQNSLTSLRYSAAHRGGKAKK